MMIRARVSPMRFSYLANCNKSNYLAGCSGLCRHGQGRSAQPAGRPANALDGMQQRQVQHVALRMAAADSVCQLRQARKQGDGQRVVATAECHQCAAGGQADLPRGPARDPSGLGQMEQRQVPPAVRRHDAIKAPAAMCSFIQRTPASARSVISKTWAIT